MKIYGNRIDYIPSIYTQSTVKKPYHSERYLTIIIRNHQIFIRYCKLKAIRIRANGNCDERDSSMFKRYLT